MEDLLDLSRDLMSMMEREYERHFVKDDPFGSRMTILLGERGIGKSTAIVQYLKGLFEQEGYRDTEVMYMPADHFGLGGRALYEVARDFSLRGGRVICFDEIHKYANWSQELKSIYDTFGQLKVIASGSSALEVLKGSHDLSRRALVKRMYGFSFREYLEMSTGGSFELFTLESILADSQAVCDVCLKSLKLVTDRTILDWFHEYLRVGYYPYFQECESEQEFFFKVEQSAHASVESDIQSIYPSITGGSVKKIMKLLAVLSQQVPFSPKLNKLTEVLDMSDERTLKTYLKYLEDAGLIKTVSKAGKGLSVLEKPDKILFNNTNQMHAFGAHKADVGTIRETFFVSAVSAVKEVNYTRVGDFAIEDNVFEVGGRNKDFSQIKDQPNSYLAIDNIEFGRGNKIPLWVFGFVQ